MGDQDGSGKTPRIADSPWAPLAFPVYRSFWIAGLFSNMGTWMHETGAQWLMTSLEPSPEMVSAVRTCMTIPVFCLALPAGVWADHFDRRTWLLASQLLLLVIAVLMTALAYFEMITPTLLLILTALLGVAMILNQPAWQALTPELVPPALVPSAVVVGSISFNLARALGPAIGGLVIANVGVWATFGFNAVSFLGVVLALFFWESTQSGSRRASPEFASELRKGVFVVKNSLHLRNALLRIVVFAFSASILWSLLSLVATEKLGYQERGFGVCLGIIGAGAVAGAWFVTYFRSRFSSEVILLAAQILFAVNCMLIGFNNQPELIMPGLFVVGGCWMTTMTTLNATAQVNLPRKFRARGMAAFMMSFALGMALGSAVWGWLGYFFDISTAFKTSAALLAMTAVGMHGMKVGSLKSEHLV